MKKEYTQPNGNLVTIDLDRVEAVEKVAANEATLHLQSVQGFRVLASYKEVLKDWQNKDRVP